MTAYVISKEQGDWEIPLLTLNNSYSLNRMWFLMCIRNDFPVISKKQSDWEIPLLTLNNSYMRSRMWFLIGVRNDFPVISKEQSDWEIALRRAKVLKNILLKFWMWFLTCVRNDFPVISKEQSDWEISLLTLNNSYSLSRMWFLTCIRNDCLCHFEGTKWLRNRTPNSEQFLFAQQDVIPHVHSEWLLMSFRVNGVIEKSHYGEISPYALNEG